VRSRRFISSSVSNNAAASSSVTRRSMFRSPPAKNVSFVLVTTTPRMPSFSATSRSTVSPQAWWKRAFIVLARWSGSSIVRVTMPPSCFQPIMPAASR
jgi:hypothetical protein